MPPRGVAYVVAQAWPPAAVQDAEQSPRLLRHPQTTGANRPSRTLPTMIAS
ncbi:MAG: hypothetical protein ACR2H2_11705 [Solirubrobacteraceae bacterium]